MLHSGTPYPNLSRLLLPDWGLWGYITIILRNSGNIILRKHLSWTKLRKLFLELVEVNCFFFSFFSPLNCLNLYLILTTIFYRKLQFLASFSLFSWRWTKKLSLCLCSSYQTVNFWSIYTSIYLFSLPLCLRGWKPWITKNN